MKKKITNLLPTGKEGYNWQYCSLGGVTRVNITSGQDIAHLGELDHKMWTVLSCPVKGLELEERTLDLIDTDRDGKIRIEEVVDASQWLCRVLKDPDKLLKGQDSVNFDEIHADDEEGAALLANARQVLSLMGKEQEAISLPELEAFYKQYDKDRETEKEEMLKALTVPDAPYGANSDAAAEAVNALRDKMADYYMRCRFLQFHDDCNAALDVSVEQVATISEKNLAESVDEIAKYPISRPLATCVMPVNEGINPAWQATFAKFKTLVLDEEYPEKESLNEAEWNAIVAKIDTYLKAKAELQKAEETRLEEKIKAERDVMAPLEKLLRLCRDFYRLLRNYVMMADFYDKNASAIFQAGRLYIDSRCCELCMRVSDMGTHATQAPLSGMYLIYCNCTSKVKKQTMDIVAAMTDGDVDNLRVGKNAVFYDCEGQDWDAVITKIVDNPISIRQAFWSPYKKFFDWITEKLNKSAAEKDAKNFEEMTAKADTATTNLTTGADGQKKEKEKKQPFDIAKFAGIFAAIGMAVGYIAGAITGLFKSFASNGWTILFFLVLIVLCISGPSMFIAWMKLRKRNLSPVLNANGWAINSKIVVNVRFGATLTSMAQYPKLVLDDPFAEKKMPRWLRWTITALVVLACLFVYMFFTNRLEGIGLRYNKEKFQTTIVGKMVYGATSAMSETVTSMVPDTDSLPPVEPAVES